MGVFLPPLRGDRNAPPPLKLPIPDDRRGTPCGCPAGSHRSPAESPLHVAIPGARKDAGPSRRLESRRSTPQFLGGSCRRPAGGGLLRKHGHPRRGDILAPSSPRLPSLGPGGTGVARIGGGTFSPPVRVGVGKPPLLLFLAGFRRTGSGGGAPIVTFAVFRELDLPVRVERGV